MLCIYMHNQRDDLWVCPKHHFFNICRENEMIFSDESWDVRKFGSTFPAAGIPS